MRSTLTASGSTSWWLLEIHRAEIPRAGRTYVGQRLAGRPSQYPGRLDASKMQPASVT